MHADDGRCQHRIDARQRMLRGDDEHEGNIAQRFDLHAADPAVVGIDADRQVGRAGQQGLPGAGQHLLAQADARRWRQAGGVALAVEGVHQVEQGVRTQQRIGGDRELTFPATGDPLHPARDGIHLDQQATPFRQQFATGRCQHGAAAGAIEQQHVERVFQLTHAVAERRRHLAEHARRGGKAAGFIDGGDQADRFRGQRVVVVAHGALDVRRGEAGCRSEVCSRSKNLNDDISAMRTTHGSGQAQFFHRSTNQGDGP